MKLNICQVAKMRILNSSSYVVQYVYALLIAIALMLLIDAYTNSTPPSWDGAFYMNMARSGITGNPNLAAPFAYRPGMPYVSNAVANLFSISLEDGFRVVVRISILLLLMSIFMLAKNFAQDFRFAFLPMVILGLSWQHVKFPIFNYTLVDVAAYPWIVISFWALITERFRLCLFVSIVGLLFKEFLAIPWLLLAIHFGYTYWRNGSRRDLTFLMVVVVMGLAMILIPRLYIHVYKTAQYVDPINDIATLRRLLGAPSEIGRTFNIIYATAGYWLPTLLLLTRARLKAIRTELARLKLLPAIWIYFSLVTLLAMYGGFNIAIFVSYSVAIQVVILAIIFRQNVNIIEIIFVIAVMFVYNKTMLHIPLQSNGLQNYLDFYGGFGEKVNINNIKRLVELMIYVATAFFLRWAIARLSSRPPAKGA
jgi:hypothetical protein